MKIQLNVRRDLALHWIMNSFYLVFKSYRKEIDQIQRSTPNSAALTLHFLTREDADREQAHADKEIGSLKQKLKAKDVMISEKDKIIVELKQSGVYCCDRDFALLTAQF